MITIVIAILCLLLLLVVAVVAVIIIIIIIPSPEMTLCGLTRRHTQLNPRTVTQPVYTESRTTQPARLNGGLGRWPAGQAAGGRSGRLITKQTPRTLAHGPTRPLPCLSRTPTLAYPSAQSPPPSVDPCLTPVSPKSPVGWMKPVTRLAHCPGKKIELLTGRVE